MYKSFTSKAIFHGVAGEEEERWDRLQRWTYEKQEFILACVCVRNAMLFGQKYPPPPSLHDTSPTRCLACKSNLNIHFQVRGGKKMSMCLKMAAEYRWAQNQSLFLLAVLNYSNKEKRFKQRKWRAAFLYPVPSTHPSMSTSWASIIATKVCHFSSMLYAD